MNTHSLKDLGFLKQDMQVASEPGSAFKVLGESLEATELSLNPKGIPLHPPARGTHGTPEGLSPLCSFLGRKLFFILYQKPASKSLSSSCHSPTPPGASLATSAPFLLGNYRVPVKGAAASPVCLLLFLQVPRVVPCSEPCPGPRTRSRLGHCWHSGVGVGHGPSHLLSSCSGTDELFTPAVVGRMPPKGRTLEILH